MKLVVGSKQEHETSNFCLLRLASEISCVFVHHTVLHCKQSLKKGLEKGET